MKQKVKNFKVLKNTNDTLCDNCETEKAVIKLMNNSNSKLSIYFCENCAKGMVKGIRRASKPSAIRLNRIEEMREMLLSLGYDVEENRSHCNNVPFFSAWYRLSEEDHIQVHVSTNVKLYGTRGANHYYSKPLRDVTPDEVKEFLINFMKRTDLHEEFKDKRYTTIK